jgi:hypothetical protein
MNVQLKKFLLIKGLIEKLSEIAEKIGIDPL